MSDTAVNEAAERLRGHVANGAVAQEDVDAALATERRNTVERIRARIEHLIVVDGIRGVDAIGTALDEVAS